MDCCNLTCCIVCVIPVVFGCIVYYLYTPIPDGLRQAWRIQCCFAMLKLSGLFIDVAERFGYGSKLELSRRFQHRYMYAPLHEDDVTVTELKFSGVPVMVFRPKKAKELSPAIVYFHGGGWNSLSPALYAGTTSDLAKWLNVVVVSVDYRLSPEHPFPAGFDDGVAATVHVLQNGDRFGIDVHNVGIAGDSAGGNLAAAVSFRLSDDNSGIPKLKFQMIIYSVLQAWDFKLPCYTHNEMSHMFPSRIMVEVILAYLGVKPTEEIIQVFLSNNHLTPALKRSTYAEYVNQVLLPPSFRRTVPNIPDIENKTVAKMVEELIINPYAFPLMAKDLSKVPPAYILTCQHDLTRDDALMYAERLRRANIDVQHKHVTDAVHDFFRRAPNDNFRYDVMLETLDELAEFANKYFK